MRENARKRLIGVALSIIAGLLYALANVGFGFWPLSFGCLVPFLGALALCDFRLAPSLYYGAAMAIAVYCSGFGWLISLTEGFIDGGMLVGGLLWLAYGCVFVANFLIFPFTFVVLHRFFSVPLLLSFVTALISYETLQFSLFPNFLGASLIHSQYLAQAADLGGVYFLSACCVCVSVGLFSCIKVCFGKQLLSASVLSSLIFPFGLLWVYGFHSYYSFGSSGENTLRVGIVQSNLVGLDRDHLNKVTHQQHLEQSRALLDKTEVDLLVWPESAYSRAIMLPLPLDAQLISKDLDVPLIFGGTSIWSHEGKKVHSNATFLIDDEQKITGAYFKNLLIPFAEYMPLSDFLDDFKHEIKALFPEHQSYQAGIHSNSIDFKGFSFAAPICYELVHPDFVRQLVYNEKANVLLSLANDSWFGDSQEPEIHLAMARLRAIEHRRWLVRAANSGYSAVVAPNGRVQRQTELGEQAHLTGDIKLVSIHSWYTQHGNWLFWCLGLLSMLYSVSYLFATKPARLDKSSHILSSQTRAN